MDACSSELSKYFLGFIKVDLGHIVGESYSEKNVHQYIRFFKASQCSREDPLHTIAVSINLETLVGAASQSGIEMDALYDPRGLPFLTLDRDLRLSCLQGKDLLEAAKRYLPFGEKWWAVRLYSAGNYPHNAEIIAAYLLVKISQST